MIDRDALLRLVQPAHQPTVEPEPETAPGVEWRPSVAPVSQAQVDAFRADLAEWKARNAQIRQHLMLNLSRAVERTRR